MQESNGGLRLVSMPVAQLLTMKAAYNPRRISPQQLQALRVSLREFGFVEPVVWNQRTQNVVGGHQRIEAASAEGIESAPVAVVDLNVADERALNLALNNIGGEFEREELIAVLAAIRAAERDLEVTGFTPAEIEDLIGDVPDFGGDAGGEQPNLGTEHTCPECGHQW